MTDRMVSYMVLREYKHEHCSSLPFPLVNGKIIWIQASGLEKLLVGGEGLICLLGGVVLFILFYFFKSLM